MKDKMVGYLAVLGLLIIASCKHSASGNAANDPLLKNPAVKELSEKIGDNPENAALYFQRGTILHRLEEDSLALNDFKKAVKLDTNKAEYYSAVGDLLFEHKDLTGSVQWLEKAIQLNPSDKTAHLKIAKMFVYLKDYPKAFGEINTVLRQDVYNPEGYFLKGIIYKDLKDTMKAISSFQTAVQVQPDFREAVIQLGLLYSMKKDPMAIKYLDNAYRMDTSDVFPLYAKGMYYQDQQQYESAKALYHDAILHDRNYADAYFNTGWILMQQDSLDKARRQFDLVTGIDPTNPKAYYNRGLCNELLGNKQEAISDYKQALTFKEGYKEASDGIKRLGGK